MPMNRIVSSAGFGLLWVVVCYVAWGTSVRHRYLTAFDATKPGDEMRVVLQRFGSPSHIDPLPVHVVGEAFYLRFWYELPFSLGVSPVTVDFNAQQVVIGKYQWNSP
jgi:hypothetical protein